MPIVENGAIHRELKNISKLVASYNRNFEFSVLVTQARSILRPSNSQDDQDPVEKVGQLAVLQASVAAGLVPGQPLPLQLVHTVSATVVPSSVQTTLRDLVPPPQAALQAPKFPIVHWGQL